MRGKIAKAVGTIVLISVAGSAEARPVNAKDVSGKTFCWQDGTKETYFSSGKFVSTGDGEGTWETVAGVISVHAHTGDWAWTGETKADGSIFNEKRGTIGKPCK